MNLILCEKNITASVAAGFVRPEVRGQGAVGGEVCLNYSCQVFTSLITAA